MADYLRMTEADHALLLEVLHTAEVRRATLAEQVQAIQDREEIRDIIRRYGYLADLRLFDELLELYAEDAERTLSGTVRETLRGKEAMRAIFSDRPAPAGSAAAPGRANRSVTRRHHIDTEIIKITDDGSRACAVALGTVAVLQGGEQATHQDIYLFSFVKQTSEWKIARQVVITEHHNNRLLYPDGHDDG